MKTPIIFALTFLCFFFNGGFAQTKKMVCPDPSEIVPAQCVKTRTKISVKILRLQSEQELGKIMQKIRNASGVSSDEFLEVKNMAFINLGDSNSLSALDLGVLGKTKVVSFEIVGKFPRVKLKLSSSSGLSVKDFMVSDAPGFAPQSLNHTLSTFDKNKLEFLWVKNSSLVGFPALLPNLAGLKYLGLRNGHIPKIESDQFRGNPKLQRLSIWECGLKEIQSGAFDFGPERTSNSSNVTDLYLYIDNAPIADPGIHPNNGLAKLKGKVVAEFRKTNLTTLGEKNWKEFLTAEKGHVLNLWQQPLICSPKMKWLKMGRKQFEEQVQDPFCDNDEGKTVFNSSLV